MPDTKVITVKNVEAKTSPSGKHYQLVIDTEGAKYANWGNTMDAGVPYQVEIIQKGNYLNIKSFTKVADKLSVKEPVVSKGNPEEIFPTPKTYAPKQESSDEKVRSMSLAYAKDWCIAKNQIENKLSYQDVLTVASVFESYIKNGITTEKKP